MIRKIDIERRWLIAALAFGCFYSALALRLAFRLPNLVQEDARQHVFWMRRFIDPTLFPNDLIADYFQAVAPAGYKFIYWILAKLGIDPLLVSKLLPAAIGVLTAYFAFKLFMQLTANSRGAFFASLLLCQLIWAKDDVISATPRAFVCPLFLAFLLFLLQRRLVLCLLMLALEGLIYPQAAFVSAGVLALQLIKWQGPSLQISRDRAAYVFFIAGLLVLGAVLIPFASSISPYGPVITRHEAMALPEFYRHGRSEFFVRGFEFWSEAPRSGLFPNGMPQHIFTLALVALVLSALRRNKFPLGLLFQVALAAVGMWTAAHLLLFRLHLPARYSQWVFQILFVMAAAMAIAVIWDEAEQWREKLREKNRVIAARIVLVLLLAGSAVLVVYPHLKSRFPNESYVQERPKPLYEFLRRQPKDCVIAAVKKPANLIPVFAQRAVFVNSEYAIPYHQAYYRIIRKRGQELVQALYSSQPEDLRSFIHENHIDLIVMGHGDAVSAQYLKKLRWFRDIAPVREINERIEQGAPPALADLVERCKIWEDKTNIVLDAHLISQNLRPNEPTP